MGREKRTDIFFDYDIDLRLVAQKPSSCREGSRLMVVDRSSGSIEDTMFTDIINRLRRGDVMVINDTRVVPAKIRARKLTTGGRVEILVLDWSGPVWRGLVKGAVSEGSSLEVEGWPGNLKIVEYKEGMAGIEAPCGGDPMEFFIRAGRTPLPPYIRRKEGDMLDREDRERYQTVYAKENGSVAAPTAGLHFTDWMLDKLLRAGVVIVGVTLHVGWGTFSPVRGDYMKHRMHGEWGRLTEDAAAVINNAVSEGRRILAVGTTTARLLESCWDSASSVVVPREDEIDLYITPGFRFNVIGALLTNFHRPRSTLLLLVDALAGSDLMRSAYNEAARLSYRFFSYGDAMLII